MKQGIILDLDGVICDTAKFHYLAWKKLASEYGYELTELDNEELKGVSRVDSLKFILKKANFILSEEDFNTHLIKKNEWYLQLIAAMDSTYLLTGVDDFLQKANSLNLPIALGSASKNALFVLEKLGIKEFFSAVVDANQVVNGKPHPETFLKAAELLQLEPNHCIVFEDSVAGIQAANDAHMMAVGIGKSSDLPMANYCIANLGEFNFDDII